MATFARTIPAFLSGLLLGAHFLRDGNILLVLASVAFPFFVLARARWAKISVRCFLVGGALIWIHTAMLLANARMLAGQSWGRMAVILGAVAAFNLLAAALIPPAKK